jgi:hypothetical protein
MLISKRQSIEDLIVEYLAQDPYIEGPDLVSLIQKSRPKTSKQAVYHAMGFLIKNEIAAKVDGKYFLSKIWLLRLRNLLLDKDNPVDAVFNLREGESISYRFPSLLTADTYWAHIFHMLTEWIPENRPVFAWYPHDWFAIGRRDVERNIFDEFEKKNKRKFMSVQGKTALDQEFRKFWATKHVAISTNAKPIFDNDTYVNVFDDYIIEVTIDRKLAGEIEGFYQEAKTLDAEGTKKLIDIVSKKHPVRIRISKKKEKASVLRRRMAKEFAIPAGLSV